MIEMREKEDDKEDENRQTGKEERNRTSELKKTRIEIPGLN
jgi:hypothetical protein